MLDCQDIEHLLDGYLDGELPASLQAEVHAHLVNCLLCRQRIGLLQAVADVVQNGGEHPSPSTDFTDRVVAAVRARRSAERSTGRSRRIVLAASGITAIAAALVLVATLAMPDGHRTAVAGRSERDPSFREALAQAGQQTRQTIAGLRGSVESLGQIGQQALEQANTAFPTDLTAVKHQPPETVSTELLFMGQLLLPLSELLELELDWPDELVEPSADGLDLI